MNAKSIISNIGTYILGAVIMLAVFSLPVLLIVGGVIVGEKILPWLMALSIIAIGVCLVILPLFTLFSASRAWAGLGFAMVSYVFGITCWFIGLLLTWMLWGGLAVLIGLFIFGVGVVPIAMLATLFKGMWPELGLLFLVVILTFGSRILGLFLISRQPEALPTGVFEVIPEPQQTPLKIFVAWLRWILLLPLAIAGYVATQVAVGFFSSWAGSIIPAFGNDVASQFANSIIGPICFVLVGAKIAPKYSFIVAICLTVVHTTLIITVISMSMSMAFLADANATYPLGWLIFTSLVSMVATIFCCLFLRYQDNYQRLVAISS